MRFNFYKFMCIYTYTHTYTHGNRYIYKCIDTQNVFYLTHYYLILLYSLQLLPNIVCVWFVIIIVVVVLALPLKHNLHEDGNFVLFSTIFSAPRTA